jgi:hypothetical protein
MALRGEPFPKNGEVEATLQAGISKEIAAATEARYPVINWEPLFGHSKDTLHDPFIQNGPSRPMLYQYLRYRLLRWKEKIANKLLVPQMSQKTMGLESSTSFHMSLPPCVRQLKPRLYTTTDAEQFYSNHGYLPPGPCEMRYAWKFNDLKPRVYYSQGLSAYTSSRYVHDVFDSLQRVRVRLEIVLMCSPIAVYSIHRSQNSILPQ